MIHGVIAAEREGKQVKTRRSDVVMVEGLEGDKLGLQGSTGEEKGEGREWKA